MYHLVSRAGQQVKRISKLGHYDPWNTPKPEGWWVKSGTSEINVPRIVNTAESVLGPNDQKQQPLVAAN